MDPITIMAIFSALFSSPLLPFFLSFFQQANDGGVMKDERLADMIKDTLAMVSTHQLPVGDGSTRGYTDEEQESILFDATWNYAQGMQLPVTEPVVRALVSVAFHQSKGQPAAGS